MPAEVERKASEERLKRASKEFHEEVMTPLAITPREPPIARGAPSQPRPDWTPVFKHVGWSYERHAEKEGDSFRVRVPRLPSKEVGGAEYLLSYLRSLAQPVARKHGVAVSITQMILPRKGKPPAKEKSHAFEIKFFAAGEKPREPTRLPPPPWTGRKTTPPPTPGSRT
ncbi:MAG: hypothetical protein AB1626_05850 [Candidatus Micrarchaeota archaeon]